MKVLISGGHLTPALAFIEFSQSQKDVELVFVGREYSQPKVKQKSREKEEVEKRGVKFISFETGKLHNRSVLEIAKQMLRFVPSLFAAKKILRTEKPDVFLSFGGYLAVPLAIVAFLRQIPIVTHEQTKSAGVANQVIGFFAKKIALSYPESAQYFSKSKTVVTGNPLRSSLFLPALQPKWIPTKTGAQILYVTGGNQGSLFVNTLLAKVMAQVSRDWLIIHQCGNPTEKMNYKQELEKVREQLPVKQKNQYLVREWVTERELAWIYQHAAVVVSRSGANTVQELATFGKSAILIPLPLTHHDEQVKNAKELEAAGTSIVLLQDEVTPEKFLETLNVMKKNLSKFRSRAQAFQKTQITNADERLLDLVKSVVK